MVENRLSHRSGSGLPSCSLITRVRDLRGFEPQSFKCQLDRFCRNGDALEQQVQGAVGFGRVLGGQPVWEIVQLFEFGERVDPGAALCQFIKWVQRI